MERQKYTIIQKPNKVISLDKIKNSEKQTKTEEKKMNQVKKRFSEKNNNYLKQFDLNRHKNSLRLGQQVPMKLVLLKNQGDEEGMRTIRQIAYHKIIEEDFIPIMISQGMAKNNHLNHLIIKKQSFCKLLATICMFLEGHKLQSAYLALNESLGKIKDNIEGTKLHSKITRNKIINNTQTINMQRCISKDLQVQTCLVQTLRQERQTLADQIRQLNTSLAKLDEFGNSKRSQIQGLNFQINENLKKVDQLEMQHIELSRQLQTIRANLNRCNQDYQNIYHFVQTQTKNKHVTAASQDYKQIEAEIYDYAAFLSMNQIAADESYKSIQMLNQCYLIGNLQISLKNISKRVVEDNDLTLQDKFKLMRDFVLKLNHQYKRKDQQYQKIIQFKTKCIQTFINKMKAWLSNWELKQQYLVNLRKAFTLDQSQLKTKLHQIFCEKMCRACYLANSKQHDSILEIYEKIQENYKMGNSFY